MDRLWDFSVGTELLSKPDTTSGWCVCVYVCMCVCVCVHVYVCISLYCCRCLYSATPPSSASVLSDSRLCVVLAVSVRRCGCLNAV